MAYSAKTCTTWSYQTLKYFHKKNRLVFKMLANVKNERSSFKGAYRHKKLRNETNFIMYIIAAEQNFLFILSLNSSEGVTKFH